MEIDELKKAYSAPPKDRSLTLARVWCFLTGWTEGDLEQPRFKSEQWDTFLKWPPDVFALCASILKRSGAYTALLQGPEMDIPLSPLQQLHECADNWLKYLRGTLRPTFSPLSTSNISEKIMVSALWDELWECRYVPLFQITSCPLLLVDLVEMMSLADEVCHGSGLPLRSEHVLTYPIVHEGWKVLQPNKYGSSLCSDRIHPSTARVLPKMHTPVSGLTTRSFSHHLTFCETDEIQPRWFIIPGPCGSAANRNHINLLIIPWPLTCIPSQIRESGVHNPPLRRGGSPGHYFTYKIHDSRRGVADIIDSLCAEASLQLGSLDGVIMPELALTSDDYEAVRERVLAKSLLLITGVGREATQHSRGENQLCVDVPLSRYHAVHFRQAKHHRWRLDASQIQTYGIGARLDPKYSYWEDIDVGDRRLLFLVLRPWLVTSALICEDLARHDPVGELLRGVGPHLVIALLMDGPQLANRWSSRYAAVLADDPGSSVLSVSSLGMVSLSRPIPTDPINRKVALWKDSATRTHELALPDGATALALTISVKYQSEDSADTRSDNGTAAVPFLTGVHEIRLPENSIQTTRAQKSPSVQFLSSRDASALARLVQQNLNIDVAPSILRELSGEARAIGREVWRLMTGIPTDVEMNKWLTNRNETLDIPTAEQRETAKQIFEWSKTNRQL